MRHCRMRDSRSREYMAYLRYDINIHLLDFSTLSLTVLYQYIHILPLFISAWNRVLHPPITPPLIISSIQYLCEWGLLDISMMPLCILLPPCMLVYNGGYLSELGKPWSDALHWLHNTIADWWYLLLNYLFTMFIDAFWLCLFPDSKILRMKLSGFACNYQNTNVVINNDPFDWLLLEFLFRTWSTFDFLWQNIVLAAWWWIFWLNDSRLWWLTLYGFTLPHLFPCCLYWFRVCI